MNQQAANTKIAGQNQGGEQPASPGESQPVGQQPEPLHESLRRKLFEERKRTQESQEEQPGGDEQEPTGQAPEGDDDPRGADEDGLDPEGQESQPGGDENPEGEELDDPEGEDPEGEGEGEPEALTVDDRQYTPEDIRALEKRNRELDADYRRKTQVTSRLRQEYQTRGEELDQVNDFFLGLARANVQQLENMDPKQMDQETFAAWREQLQQAKAGAQQLENQIKGVKQAFQKNRDKMLDQQAAESSEVLSGIDPRWNNEFYGKIRDFAVESGRYTPQEFADVTDWRTMEGLIALYDMSQAQKRITENRGERRGAKEQGQSNESEPAPGRRRRRRARQPRNNQGQFQSAQKAVHESTNAKADGSLRNFFQQRLAKERG